MNTPAQKLRTLVLLLATLATLFTLPTARAQSPAPQAAAQPLRARITQAIDEEQLVPVRASVHPLATRQADRGLVADSQLITRMHLVLQRSAEQDAALRQLLDDQQNKSSANYHAWVTPEQFGKQFGPSDADIAAVTSWLTSHGFQNITVTTGRTAVEFSGNVAQVRNAFHTDIHKFFVDGEEHFANVSVPQIPAALAPVLANIASLHNFRSQPMVHHVGTFRKNLATGVTEPLFTYTDLNGTFYGVGPADFAKIYNVPPTATGAGRSIAIVGRSNINVQDVCDFRTMFGLTPACPAYSDPNTGLLKVILNGPDPGLVSGDEGESDLDVEWAGAVAPSASIKFVTTQSSQTDAVDGVTASAFYIVNNNVADVMSVSYGSCESGNGAGGNAAQNLLWQQAAAQGITVVVAAGDNGSAGCDNQNTQTTAIAGNAVSGTASTPYDTAVGGTDFDDATTHSTYWATATGNNATTQESALSYIPEVPWNDSCGATGLPTSCTASSTTLNLIAGSGGPSAFYTTKPSWQVGLGDTVRDIPDVSLFAGDGVAGSFYIVCESDQNIAGATGCNLTTFTTTAPYHDFQGVGGTSGGAPSFAGIMALVDQKTGTRQGVANYELYNLAHSEIFANCNSNSNTGPAGSCVFNDITKGNNAVACSGTLDCSSTSGTGIGVETTTNSGGTLAYAAVQGYDLATGLGSLNVTNLLNNWVTPVRTTPSITLNPPNPASPTLNSSVTFNGTLTKGTGTAAPTGQVILENNTTGAAIDVVVLTGTGTTFSFTTQFLPAGTYPLIAHYGGDGTYAAADSAPIPLNIANHNSAVVVSWVGSTGTLSQAAQSVQYGSPYILRVDVEDQPTASICENITTSAVSFVCPTGTVQLFKNPGVPLNDFPNAQTANATNVAKLNDRGFAEDQPIQLPVGAYSITATYAADAASSYNSQSASNALAVTITQATTTTTVSASPTSIVAGGSVTLTAIVASASNSSLGPTGTVQFKNGSSTLSGAVTCTPTGYNQTTNVGAFCTATLTTTSLAFLTPPPAPFHTPRFYTVPVWTAALSLLILFLLALNRLPSQKRRIYAYSGLLLFACAAAGIAGCGGSSSGGGGGHTDSITAVYSGDTNYGVSTSSAVSVTIQ